MKTKIFYHIIEDCQNGDLGYQGYCDNLNEANKTIEHLESCFEDSFFWIFESIDEQEPPIITV